MSNEAMIGIIITVVIGIAGFFAYTNRKDVNINQTNGSGNQNMNNNTIGNEINSNNKDKK